MIMPFIFKNDVQKDFIEFMDDISVIFPSLKQNSDVIQYNNAIVNNDGSLDVRFVFITGQIATFTVEKGKWEFVAPRGDFR